MPKFTKKKLKQLVNSKGFFTSLPLELDKNMPDKFKNKIPIGATYFEGVASTSEINRNGYIIRPEAWKRAIKGYMENPVILLQHETEKPIGRALAAEVVNDSLKVYGYVYDELTDGLFSKNLLQALSTGHMTKAVEFENEKTSKIISEKEFNKLPYDEQFSGDWILAVTDLEFVEFSLVTIGSNRKSFITAINAIKAFLQNDNKLSQVAINSIIDVNAEIIEDDEKETDEKKEPEKEVDEKETDEKKEIIEKKESEESENPVEKPEVSEKEADEKESEKIIISEEERQELIKAAKRLQEAIDATTTEKEIEAAKETKKADSGSKNTAQLPTEVTTVISQLADALIMQNQEIDRLKKIVESIPARKGLAYSASAIKPVEEKKSLPIVDFFKKAGVIK